jgi:hypothetical protein
MIPLIFICSLLFGANLRANVFVCRDSFFRTLLFFFRLYFSAGFWLLTLGEYIF